MRRRRSGLARKVRAASLALLGLSIPIVAVLAALAPDGGQALANLAGAIIVAPWISVAVGLFVGLGQWHRGEVVASPDGVRFEAGSAKRELARARIAAARVDPVRDGLCRLTLEHDGGDVDEVELASPDEARRIIDAAALDAQHKRATFALSDGFFPRLMHGLGFWLALTMLPVVLTAAFFGAAPSAGVGVLTAFAAPFLAYALSRWTTSTRVTVGVDGVLHERRLTRRFHPMEGLASVDTAHGDVELAYADGRRERMAVPGASVAVASRIREGLAASKAAGGEQVPAEVLARGGRTIADWRAAIRSLVGEDRGYRVAALEPEHLARVLEDPGAPAEHRIGAALALAAGDDASRARVRVAAETCAEPKLRVALESTLDDAVDETAVEDAMTSRDR
jgi:hypothetical protein